MNGQFFLKDVGSRNGTFINSFRLSKPMTESDDICLYSQDLIRYFILCFLCEVLNIFIVRFGNQVRDNSTCITERCILARINLYFPIENKLCSRPEEDRKVIFKSKYLLYFKISQVLQSNSWEYRD